MAESEKPMLDTSTDESPDSLQGSQARVMLVDDQAIVAEALRRMLADEEDIEYHYCGDPSKALTEATAFHPTVILQDLVMPDIDGLMLLKFYRSNPETSQVPVIVLSTKEDPSIKSNAFALGASDYLVKFPDKIEMVARIHAHSRSFMAQKQRDEAYRAMSEMQKELELKNIELERLSSQDGLTGISNRRAFDEFSEKEWSRAVRDHSSLSLILIDIDHFKPYNDNYGHQGGDDCLRKVAQALADTVKRPTDIVARYGGEEFAVVMPGTDVEGATKIAEALRAGIEALGLVHEHSSTSGVVTISLGVATFSPTAEGAVADLIGKADEAMYQAKKEGRNQYKLAE